MHGDDILVSQTKFKQASINDKNGIKIKKGKGEN
jgi:hypothetical protein